MADIVSGSTPVEKYQQDKQSHEELALKFQLSEEERMKRREPLVDDSILEVKRSVYFLILEHSSSNTFIA